MRFAECGDRPEAQPGEGRLGETEEPDGWAARVLLIENKPGISGRSSLRTDTGTDSETERADTGERILRDVAQRRMANEPGLLW